tara:strand:+ start:2365 stop:2511 length:147 start_codon:yes stop_codon:yes gene_type:complete
MSKLAIALLATLVACGDKDDDTGEEVEDTAQEATEESGEVPEESEEAE